VHLAPLSLSSSPRPFFPFQRMATYPPSWLKSIHPRFRPFPPFESPDSSYLPPKGRNAKFFVDFNSHGPKCFPSPPPSPTLAIYGLVFFPVFPSLTFSFTPVPFYPFSGREDQLGQSPPLLIAILPQARLNHGRASSASRRFSFLNPSSQISLTPLSSDEHPRLVACRQIQCLQPFPLHDPTFPLGLRTFFPLVRLEA